MWSQQTSENVRYWQLTVDSRTNDTEVWICNFAIFMVFNYILLSTTNKLEYVERTNDTQVCVWKCNFQEIYGNIQTCTTSCLPFFIHSSEPRDL